MDNLHDHLFHDGWQSEGRPTQVALLGHLATRWLQKLLANGAFVVIHFRVVSK